MSALKLEDCWAKTDPTTIKPCLNVSDHCLTVGHVACALGKQLPQTLLKLLPEGWNTLIAAHDIGKITPGFQIKCTQWDHYDKTITALQQNGLCSAHPLISHWHLQNRPPFRDNKRRHSWLISTNAHHGSYYNGKKRSLSQIDIFEGGKEEEFKKLRDELLDILIERFGNLKADEIKLSEYPERIHLLTGLTIFSDWIGSNSDWFPHQSSTKQEDLAHQARRIISQLHLSPQIKKNLSFGQLFQEHNSAHLITPRPLQTVLLENANSAGLYIIEAPMGMGKTEAALSLAYDRWKSGDAKGIYFALPTQLTSERIHDRITTFLENIIDEDASGIQTLIHGNAWLNDESRKAINPTDQQAEHNDTDEALKWYGSTRKSLLAPFGTGTIDQALLSVLPTRFAALRFFALAGKVVVIDEVHSFDPYVSGLIDRLVQFLIKAGSTVIILSATLTSKRRKELLETAGASETLEASMAYPLISALPTGESKALQYTLPYPLDDQPFHLKHKTLSGNDSLYWEKVAAAVTSGANVVIIRNTVQLAQETYLLMKSLLTEAIPDQDVGLLHSRFPQKKRLTQEGIWVTKLGKEENNRPHGSLLISTQIIEQSVDIDADHLISDWAPVDLILQRAGRLHRHERKKKRPDGFEQPILTILYPEVDWERPKKEVEQAITPHHFIYPALSLWQAEAVLKQKDLLKIPSEIKPTLEQAHATMPEQPQETLSLFWEDYEQRRHQLTVAANTKDIFDIPSDDLEGHHTRYKIQPSVSLILLSERPTLTKDRILLKLHDGETLTFHPAYFSLPIAKKLHAAAIRISRHLVGNTFQQSPDWLESHLTDACLGILAEGSQTVNLYPEEKQTYHLTYSNSLGIRHSRNEQATPSFHEPEEDWF